MKFVPFGVKSIQKGRRIRLDDNLLHALDIKEGDKVTLSLDIEQEAIIIKKPRLATNHQEEGI